MHLSASTSPVSLPNAKTLVCTVQEALKIGADAVSVHVNIGDGTEREMLADLGHVCREAQEWGMPLLAMMYPRGEKIKDEYDPEVIMHVARLGPNWAPTSSRFPTPARWIPSARWCWAARCRWSSPAAPRWIRTGTFWRWSKAPSRPAALGFPSGRNVFQHRRPQPHGGGHQPHRPRKCRGG